METKPEAHHVSWGQTLTSASARGSCQKCQILGLCCRANSESHPQVGHGVIDVLCWIRLDHILSRAEP